MDSEIPTTKRESKSGKEVPSPSTPQVQRKQPNHMCIQKEGRKEGGNHFSTIPDFSS